MLQYLHMLSNTHRNILLPILATMCLLLAACGSSTPPQPSKIAEDPELVLWPRGNKAISLNLVADKDLNSYNSRAHSLQICVYQMSKSDPFLELTKTSEGIQKLLQAKPFDDSIKGVTRVFIQPQETSSIALDRVAEAKFIGIVCGYFDGNPNKLAKAWEISPKESREGFIFKSSTYSAGTIEINLRLEANGMEEEEPEDVEPPKSTNSSKSKSKAKAEQTKQPEKKQTLTAASDAEKEKNKDNESIKQEEVTSNNKENNSQDPQKTGE